MINFMTLKPGQRLQLKDGTVAEVTENMADGIWIQARRESGEEELVHCEEVAGSADEA